MAFASPYGPVKIIPASAMRSYLPDRSYSKTLNSSNQRQKPQPINAAYYNRFTGGGAAYNNQAFLPENTSRREQSFGAPGPYGAEAFVDTTDFTRLPYSQNFSESQFDLNERMSPGRPFARNLLPPYRRARTAPARFYGPRKVYRVRPRGHSIDVFDASMYRSFSGPRKTPFPMYRKRREPWSGPFKYRETEFGSSLKTKVAAGSGFDTRTGTLTRKHLYLDEHGSPSLQRRLSRRYYSPSYATYPPSTLRQRQRFIAGKYPLWLRILLKIAQLIIGASILGLVLGPMRQQSLYRFVIETRTEWQMAVVASVSIFAILTFLMLLTVCCASKSPIWRQVDGFVSLIGSIGYVFIGCLETWYAVCYPPVGGNIPQLCYRLEWAIAAMFSFLNLLLYAIDFALAFRTGVSFI